MEYAGVGHFDAKIFFPRGYPAGISDVEELSKQKIRMVCGDAGYDSFFLYSSPPVFSLNRFV